MAKVEKSKTNQKGKTSLQQKLRIKKQIRYLGAVLMVVGLLVYGNTLSHQYCFDDYSVIAENYVTQEGFAGIPTHLTHSYRYGYWNSAGTLYRPLSLVMFAAEWAIAPDNPFIGHLINVLLLVFTLWIIWLCTLQLIGRKNWTIAFFTVLFFAVHAIHTEVIANIKSRDEILAFLLCMASLYSALKAFSKSTSWAWFVGCIFLYTLALFSKESAVTFLPVFFLAFGVFKKPTKWPLLLTLLAPIFLFMVVRFQVLGTFGGIKSSVSVLDNTLVNAPDLLTRLATAIYISGLYFYKLLLPYPLVSDMGFSQIPYVSIGNPVVLLTLLGTIFVTFWTIKNLRSHPILFFGWFFFGITYFIFSNIALTIGSSYGERFLYTPSYGFLLCVIYVYHILFKKPKGLLLSKGMSGFYQLFKGPYLALWVYAIVLGGMSMTRNQDWFDSFSLHQADIQKAPNCAKTNFHLGLEYNKKALDASTPEAKANYFNLATSSFSKAIDIYPAYAEANEQLGLAAYRQNKPDEAMNFYEKALKTKPKDATVYSNMGIILMESGQLEQAISVYEKAIELDPRYVDARRNLGAVLANQGNFEKAIQQFSAAYQYAPNDPIINFYLGSAYLDQGDETQARPYLNRAYQLDPSLPKK